MTRCVTNVTRVTILYIVSKTFLCVISILFVTSQFSSNSPIFKILQNGKLPILPKNVYFEEKIKKSFSRWDLTSPRLSLTYPHWLYSRLKDRFNNFTQQLDWLTNQKPGIFWLVAFPISFCFWGKLGTLGIWCPVKNKILKFLKYFRITRIKYLTTTEALD